MGRGPRVISRDRAVYYPPRSCLCVHELVFGILFLAIVTIPFRQRKQWAWWACWAVLLANVTYALTFGAHDAAILRQSLIGIIALPVLLLIQVPAFFGKRAHLAAHQAR